MELQTVPALSLTWEEFFVHIPIQEQKETKFTYDAQQTIECYLPRNMGLSIQKCWKVTRLDISLQRV